MDARSMVFDVGDRVTGWGRLVSDSDGDWLDLTHGVVLSYPGWHLGLPRPRSSHSIRIHGADVGATQPSEFATITGLWRGDAIEVESQSSEHPPREPTPPWTEPPCAPPAGGWRRGRAEENLRFELGDLRSSGAAVGIVTFRPSPDQAVLVVTATDIDAVEAVLRPQLGDRLCVIPSRWTRAEMDAVRARLDDHWEDWHLTSVGDHADEHGQFSVTVTLVRVTPDLAGWADTVPAGLLTLLPRLTVS